MTPVPDPIATPVEPQVHGAPAGPQVPGVPPGTAPGRHRRRWPWVVAAVLGVVALVAVAALVWFIQPQPLLPEATAALASTDQVTFSDENGWLTFTPATGPPPDTGLIFYPGGKVPAEAYAPAAQAIAEQGYTVVVVPMPFNFAVFGIDKAAEVRAVHPEITTWAVGGHSLGGAMAAEYVKGHGGAAEGLVFWAAYPAADLSAQPLEVASIYGTLDSGKDTITSPDTAAKLPPGARFVPIEGGNHGQFGYYTGQPNDPSATISREEQQAQAVAATVELLQKISPTR